MKWKTQTETSHVIIFFYFCTRFSVLISMSNSLFNIQYGLSVITTYDGGRNNRQKTPVFAVEAP